MAFSFGTPMVGLWSTVPSLVASSKLRCSVDCLASSESPACSAGPGDLNACAAGTTVAPAADVNGLQFKSSMKRSG